MPAPSTGRARVAIPCCRSRGRNITASCCTRPSAISLSLSPAGCWPCATSGRRCRRSTHSSSSPASRRCRCASSAMAITPWLVKHPKVAWVSYPGLANDRYHALAQKYVPKGAGGVFTFGLKGGYEAGVKLVSNVQLFSHLANIGDTRSLIIHPASTTHRQLTDAQKITAGAGPDVVRLSIGIEDKADIIADLEQALAD